MNKHIQSIGTRVRDFMVRFYRLKLVLQCIHNDVICCLLLLLLLFPLRVILHRRLLCCSVRSVCVCLPLSHENRINLFNILFMFMCAQHTVCVIFFIFVFVSLYSLFLFVASLLFAVFRFVFILCVFFYYTYSV